MKNAVVTGGTKGIGRALCKLLAKEGFNLAFCARNQQDVKDLESDLMDQYPNTQCIASAVDVSVKAEVEKFAEQVKSDWKKVDLLINNAGVFIPGLLLEEEDGLFEKMMTTNVNSAYYLTRKIAPLMIKQKSGHIFNICSIASIKAYAGGGSYTTSKFALLGLSKSFREELKEFNVKVTSVMPGATFTASWEGVDIPESRFMSPEDIAQSVLDIYNLSDRTVVEEIVLRPLLGDI